MSLLPLEAGAAFFLPLSIVLITVNSLASLAWLFVFLATVVTWFQKALGDHGPVGLGLNTVFLPTLGSSEPESEGTCLGWYRGYTVQRPECCFAHLKSTRWTSPSPVPGSG